MSCGHCCPKQGLPRRVYATLCVNLALGALVRKDLRRLFCPTLSEHTASR